MEKNSIAVIITKEAKEETTRAGYKKMPLKMGQHHHQGRQQTSTKPETRNEQTNQKRGNNTRQENKAPMEHDGFL
eukprot:5689937-Ditylum_brightwellii.AAC.1